MRAASVVGLVLITSCALGPRPPPSPPRTTGLGLSFARLDLSNGLRVVVVTDTKAPEVQVTMRYAVGGADDPATQQGMAHLVEHLMFQQVLGSETVFSQLGEHATYFNGETTNDATTYVARSDRSQLGRLLSIEATRVGFRCTTITPAVFEREREVVVNELRYRDEGEQLYNALMRGIYQDDHPYRRAVGGTAESVGAITFKDACAFADAYYTTTNGVLVVSGNITPDEVSSATKPFLGRIARHEPRGIRNPIPRVMHRVQQGEIDAPVEDTSVMISWALPLEPLLQVRARAVAAAAVHAIDGAVDGRVHGRLIGDERAPAYAIVIEPAENETTDHVISQAQSALDQLGSAWNTQIASLGELAFDKMQQTAIYQLYQSLEDDGPRDSRLASYALAGRDPREALADEFRGLREMTPGVAAEIAGEYISRASANIVIVKPIAPRAGSHIALHPPIHAPGQRNDIVDVQAAHEPEHALTREVTGITTRRLPNGLRVVLLPLTTVPTVDIRLIFDAGSGNEPIDRRGSALVAAYGLGWDLRYLNDLLRLSAAGGNPGVDVEPNSTTFSVRGVDMHLDILLAGLRRWVRDGSYDMADGVVEALRQNSKQQDDEGALTDAWRAALFGATHPYAMAGLARHASSNLTIEDGERFRSSYFTPDDATLVIAGHFDPALADQWIDYLFGDWAGTAEAHPVAAVGALDPASLALLVDGPTTQLRIALPAMAGTRAQQLIATAMLDQIAQDVRHQLGAAYVIAADLAEVRGSAHYVVAGTVDDSRTADALALVRDRLAELRSSPEQLARAFVVARRRVLTRIASVGGGSVAIADTATRDVSLGRAPLGDLTLSNEIAKATIENMQPVLEGFALEHAVVLMRGPRAAIDPAFAALERHPKYVMFDQVSFDAEDDAPVLGQPAHRRNHALPDLDDLEDAITSNGGSIRSGWTLVIGAGLSLGSDTEASTRVKPDCCNGGEATVFAGYHIDRKNALGIQVSTGLFRGTYTVDIDDNVFRYRIVPVDVEAALQVTTHDRFWAGILGGVHLDWRTVPMPGYGGAAELGAQDTVLDTGIAIGLEGGVDVVRFGAHSLGAFAALQATLASETSHSSLTFGLAYRR